MPNESETIAAARTSSLQRSHKRNIAISAIKTFLFSNDTDKDKYNDGENHNRALPPCISPTKKEHGDIVHFTKIHKRDITKDTKDQR